MPEVQANDTFKVLLMINKRGFRHNPPERAFVASQINWVYTEPFVEVATFARLMMSFVQEQIFLAPRERRSLYQTDTVIILSRDQNTGTSAVEKLTHSFRFGIEIVPIAPSEKQELQSIISGSVTSSSASDVGEYLKSLGEDPIHASTLAIGVKANAFLQALGEHMCKFEKSLVPIYMEQTNDENGNHFSIALGANEKDPVNMLRIWFKA